MDLNKLAEEIIKESDFFDNIYGIQGSSFPMISSQTKWKYAKAGNIIELSDGNIVHKFELPDGYKSDNFKVIKSPDGSIFNFGKDAKERGTAQVHNSGPSSIYFTLHNGDDNPTLKFNQREANLWFGTRKKKVKINKKAFIEGFNEKLAESHPILDKIISGVGTGTKSLLGGVMAAGHNPMASAGIGLLGGAAYDLGRRALYNTAEENEQETLLDRLPRYALPAAGLGVLGGGLKSMFPDYYKFYPMYKP